MKSFNNKVEASITKVMNSHPRKTKKVEGTFPEWDGLMRKNYHHLINPPLLYKKMDLIARKECKWEAPPIGWKKLNFDGTSKGNLGKVGI